MLVFSRPGPSRVAGQSKRGPAGYPSCYLLAVRFGWNLAVSTLFFLWLCPSGNGWESFPEFQSLTESEAASLEGPGLLNPEYASDVWSYSRSSEWEYLWLSHEQALNLGFGSLSTTRFLLENRLKIERRLSPEFEFRYNYFDESNLERQSMHHVFELIAWPSPQVGLVFYGEPSFRKPNDDTGIAVLIRPGARHEIRIFNTFVDVTRLKYPDSSDSFIEPDLPYARGIVGRVWAPSGARVGTGNFLEYALRWETPTAWRFFNLNYRYFYWKWLVSLHGRLQLSRTLSAALRAQLDRKREWRSPLGATPVDMGDWYTRRLGVFSEVTLHELGPGDEWALTLGLSYAGRGWTADRGRGAYDDILPYFRLRVPGLGTPPRKGNWLIGYVMTRHRETGDESIGIRSERSGIIEQRLNLGYEISFGEIGRMALTGSADLNEFGSRNTWDGGGGQLELFF